MRQLIHSLLIRARLVEESVRVFARADGGLVVHAGDTISLYPGPGSDNPEQEVSYRIGPRVDGRVPLYRDVRRAVVDPTSQPIVWYTTLREARRALEALAFGAPQRARGGGWGVAVAMVAVFCVVGFLASSPRSASAVAATASAAATATPQPPPSEAAIRAAEEEGARLARALFASDASAQTQEAPLEPALPDSDAAGLTQFGPITDEPIPAGVCVE